MSAGQALKRALRMPQELRARWRDRRLAQRPHHYLSVCAIFYNEAPFLDEWIRFHLGIGVEHFYLYNNRSTDDFATVLAPYVERGLVTVFDWPYRPGQHRAYDHCAKTFADRSRWIAFFDLDEFLFSPQQADIRPLLRQYEDRVCVFVRSYYFGSSGRETRPREGQIAGFMRRGHMQSEKSIANPRWMRTVRRNAHRFRYLGPDPFPHPKQLTAPTEILRMNHYWSRSLDDLRKKQARGRASSGGMRILQECMERDACISVIEDKTVLGIADEIWRNADAILNSSAAGAGAATRPARARAG